VGGATVASPVALASTSALTWGAASRVDHQAPYYGYSIQGVSCLSSGLCVAVDDGGDVVTTPNALATSPVWTVTHVDTNRRLSAVSCPGSGLCVAVDNAGALVTSTNPTGGPSAWTVTSLLTGLNVVSCPTTTLCVAGTSFGYVATSTNPTGTPSAWSNADVDGSTQLKGLSCPSSTLCVAVDSAGNVITSTNPTGGASAWTVTHVDGTNTVFGVSCSSTSRCVAVDSAGDVVTSTNPTGGASAWTVTNVDTTPWVYAVSCPSSSLCVASDSSGGVVTSTNPTGGASAWTRAQADTLSLFGMSCPSTGLCVGVDSDGDVMTSSNPTGGASAWTVTLVDGSDAPDAVSCPNGGFCAAVDGSGNVVTSTNPTGGASAWTVAHVDSYNTMYGVSCPTSGMCVAVDDSGNAVSSTNPTGGVSAWTVTRVDGNVLYAVSCPTSGLCVAVDNVGDVVTSTNPTGGASAWTVTKVDGIGWLNGVSCPTTHLCVAVDPLGDVVTSTNPTGGASAWTLTSIGAEFSPYAVSCPSSLLCVAVDSEGGAVTATNPTGGTSAWTAADVDGSRWLNSVSCSSLQLCVAVDVSGNAVSSTNPTGGASAWTATNLSANDDWLGGVSCPPGGPCVVVDETSGSVTTGTSSVSLQDLPSTQQYFLHGSDGSTWESMDTTLLADTFTPATTGTALFSANADLWTEDAGFNQDLGICLVAGALVLSSCPSVDVLAWKESGGFAGTYSPNAAYVQAAAAVLAGSTETAFVVWKTNIAMPAGDTIAAGAGGGPSFSPARLTVTLPDTSDVVSGASSTQQYAMNGSDGSTWKYVDAGALKLTLTPASSVDTVLSANADLWTSNAGFNQDIGICVAAGATLPAGSCPSADVVIWKESGGFAGTFSPNAAFAQTAVAMSAGTYSVGLVWKANKVMPSGDTITIGAGSGPYSPTRLVALQYPAGGGGETFASSTKQYLMSGGSDGATWKVLDATSLTLTVPQATGCQLAIGGNADLWTEAAGFNQDIGIQVTPAGGTAYVAAWKESGGFAGTFSPNAAFVETVIPISAASSYSITLVWKTNVAMPSSDQIAVAAGSTGAYSPTTLTATKHC
jgi:hypothetical protein